jgi:hypothetical protein
MIEHIEKVEYRSGVLPSCTTPESLAVQTWEDTEIPADVRMAIYREDLLSLGGRYGQRNAAGSNEYDQLRIGLADRTIDIEMFNRKELVDGGDARLKRIHGVLCKLNKAMMAVPDVFTAEQRSGADPRLPLPPGGKFTYRDQANVLTLLAFRNGPIEDLHAGDYSPLLENPGLSRITDEEMKKIMIAASSRLAELLALRDSDPDAFAQLLAASWRQVKNWER